MMSTVSAANNTATSCLFKMKEEEKKMEGVANVQVKKNPDLDGKIEDLSDDEYYSGEDEEAQAQEVGSPVKPSPDLPLGPQVTMKEQLGLDKDDKSSSKCKEQLLGSIEVSTVGAMLSKEPQVQVMNLTVESPGRPDNVVPTPFRSSTSKSTLFTLKEGCKQQIRFEFKVSKNTVCGLKYIGEVWKKGIKVNVFAMKVDHSKKTVGTFNPREEIYRFELEERTTPSGIFARGSYSARTRFVDDDGKCHFDATYYFDIQKHWGSSS